MLIDGEFQHHRLWTATYREILVGHFGVTDHLTLINGSSLLDTDLSNVQFGICLHAFSLNLQRRAAQLPEFALPWKTKLCYDVLMAQLPACLDLS